MKPWAKSRVDFFPGPYEDTVTPAVNQSFEAGSNQWFALLLSHCMGLLIIQEGPLVSHVCDKRFTAWSLCTKWFTKKKKNVGYKLSGSKTYCTRYFRPQKIVKVGFDFHPSKDRGVLPQKRAKGWAPKESCCQF